MNLKVGDRVKVLRGDYQGLTFTVLEIGARRKHHFILLSNNRWYHLTDIKKV